LADDVRLRPGMTEDDVDVNAEIDLECQICMAAPRCVRFACGHLVCCEQCTKNLIATEGHTLPQNKCPTCRARIIVVDRGNHLTNEQTFVIPATPPPPAVPEATRFDLKQSALAQPGETRHITLSSPGMLGFSFYTPQAFIGRFVVNSVLMGSQADAQGVPVGCELLAFNNRSIRGLTKQQVLDLPEMQQRPCQMTICVAAPAGVAVVVPPSPQPQAMISGQSVPEAVCRNPRQGSGSGDSAGWRLVESSPCSPVPAPGVSLASPRRRSLNPLRRSR